MTSKIIFLVLLLLSTSFARLEPTTSEEGQEFINRIGELINGPQTIVPLKDTKTDILNFAEGFLEGIGSASVFAQIKACIADAEDFTSDVVNGIEDIKTKDAAKVKEGIALLGQAAQIVPTAVQLCKASGADLETLYKMIKAFQNPTSFLYYIGKSLLINHVQVYKEVSNAVSAYEQQDYIHLGYWVGVAMDTIILGEKTQDTKTEILDFAKGFLQGVGSASAFDPIKSCLSESEQVIGDIGNGITDIATKEPSKVKAGIELLGQAAQIVPDAVQLCKTAEVDIKTLIKMVESFKNPISFLYYVGKSLLINHVEVFSEVSGAVASYEHGDYTELGYYVGKAMDTIFLGEDQTISQEFVDHLNKVSGWKAAMPSKFEGMTYREIKQNFLGAELVDLSKIDGLTVFNYEGLYDNIPSYFNSSEQWPGCVHPIRDQGHCGSCWAFGASEAISDRFCIASNGSINVVLSPQYLVSCDTFLNQGCNGGIPFLTWYFMASDGLVSDSCFPYQSANGTSPTCSSFTTCADGSPIKNYYVTKGSVVQLGNVESIQADIMQYGPVEAAFTVYQDFMTYSGGIYKHTSGSLLGGHAVKIIGWGNEDGTDYWIVANSWGTSWGLDGFFKIAFGECGIDSAVVSGQADTARMNQTENKFWWKI